jgi:hypothetical protein
MEKNRVLRSKPTFLGVLICFEGRTCIREKKGSSVNGAGKTGSHIAEERN